jgi:hypothetical protein
MKILIAAIVVFAALNAVQLLYSSFSDRLFLDAVPDEQTAIEVGRAVLLAAYGEEVILNQEPFSARYNPFRGHWAVSGTRPDAPDIERGIGSVLIRKNDGRILRIQLRS